MKLALLTFLNKFETTNLKKNCKKDLDLAEKEKENAIKLAEANLKNSLQEQLAKKDKEITQLKAKSELELAKKLAAKEKTEITAAKS